MIYDWTWQLLKKSLDLQSTNFCPWFEVKLRISHHSLKKSENSITPTKDLVFVLDELNEEPTKKKRKKANAKDESVAGVTMKNFGSNVSVPKVKGSSLLKVAWRCRLDNQGDGSKLLMPVRPIAILSGMLEVEAQNVSLLWKWNSMVDDVDLLGTWPWKGWEQ